jgi:biopolymer transport protein ExbD
VARIKQTPVVRVFLVLLAIYVVVMLSLVVYRFAAVLARR